MAIKLGDQGNGKYLLKQASITKDEDYRAVYGAIRDTFKGEPNTGVKKDLGFGTPTYYYEMPYETDEQKATVKRAIDSFEHIQARIFSSPDMHKGLPDRARYMPYEDSVDALAVATRAGANILEGLDGIPLAFTFADAPPMNKRQIDAIEKLIDEGKATKEALAPAAPAADRAAYVKAVLNSQPTEIPVFVVTNREAVKKFGKFATADHTLTVQSASAQFDIMSNWKLQEQLEIAETQILKDYNQLEIIEAMGWTSEAFENEINTVKDLSDGKSLLTKENYDRGLIAAASKYAAVAKMANAGVDSEDYNAEEIEWAKEEFSKAGLNDYIPASLKAAGELLKGRVATKSGLQDVINIADDGLDKFQHAAKTQTGAYADDLDAATIAGIAAHNDYEKMLLTKQLDEAMKHLGPIKLVQKPEVGKDGPDIRAEHKPIVGEIVWIAHVGASPDTAIVVMKARTIEGDANGNPINNGKRPTVDKARDLEKGRVQAYLVADTEGLPRSTMGVPFGYNKSRRIITMGYVGDVLAMVPDAHPRPEALAEQHAYWKRIYDNSPKFEKPQEKVDYTEVGTAENQLQITRKAAILKAKTMVAETQHVPVEEISLDIINPGFNQNLGNRSIEVISDENVDAIRARAESSMAKDDSTRVAATAMAIASREYDYKLQQKKDAESERNVPVADKKFDEFGPEDEKDLKNLQQEFEAKRMAKEDIQRKRQELIAAKMEQYNPDLKKEGLEWSMYGGRDASGHVEGPVKAYEKVKVLVVVPGQVAVCELQTRGKTALLVLELPPKKIDYAIENSQTGIDLPVALKAGQTVNIEVGQHGAPIVKLYDAQRERQERNEARQEDLKAKFENKPNSEPQEMVVYRSKDARAAMGIMVTEMLRSGNEEFTGDIKFPPNVEFSASVPDSSTVLVTGNFFPLHAGRKKLTVCITEMPKINENNPKAPSFAHGFVIDNPDLFSQVAGIQKRKDDVAHPNIGVHATYVPNRGNPVLLDPVTREDVKMAEKIEIANAEAATKKAGQERMMRGEPELEESTSRT